MGWQSVCTRLWGYSVHYTLLRQRAKRAGKPVATRECLEPLIYKDLSSPASAKDPGLFYGQLRSRNRIGKERIPTLRYKFNKSHI